MTFNRTINTTILISKKVRDELKGMKNISSTPYRHIIKKLIEHYKLTEGDKI